MATSKPLVVYFGTANRGRGIHVFALDRETGRLTERSVTDIKGRGWIELDPTERFLFAATDPDRIDSFAVVNGRNTLPASTGAGAPARPVTDKAARHVWARIISVRSGDIGVVAPANG